MKIKRWIASMMACVFLVMNLSAVCFAVDTDESAADTATEESGETLSDGADADEIGTLSISFDELAQLLGISSEDTDEAEAALTGKVSVSDSSYLNLRSGSGMDYDVIGHLFTGDEVQIIGEDGDWYEVVVSERTGYVYKDYIDVAEEALIGGQMDEGMMQILLYLMMGMSGTDSTDDVSTALTPDGNLTLVDDYSEEYEDGSGKQFITVVTKAGNTFYLIIDRDDEGEQTVHFLNLVDEADLLALMDKDAAAQYSSTMEVTVPEVTETTQPEEMETEPEPVEETEESGGVNLAPVLLLVVVLIGGGGFFAYTKLKGGKKKQEQQKPDPDADYLDEDEDFDLPDDTAEDYDDEDEDEDESTLFDADDNEPV